MQIPGAVWSALLIALPLLALWLQDSFPAAVWAAPVAGLLLILAKTVEAVRTAPAPSDGARGADEPGRVCRWLLG